MTVEEVVEAWAAEAALNLDDLGNESARVEQVHDKFVKMLGRAKRFAREREAVAKRVRLERREFYVFGPTAGQIARGERGPPQGRVLKTEVAQYLDADPLVVEADHAAAEAQDVVDAIASKIAMIKNRSYRINNAIQDMLFKAGR